MPSMTVTTGFFARQRTHRRVNALAAADGAARRIQMQQHGGDTVVLAELAKVLDDVGARPDQAGDPIALDVLAERHPADPAVRARHNDQRQDNGQHSHDAPEIQPALQALPVNYQIRVQRHLRCLS